MAEITELPAKNNIHQTQILAALFSPALPIGAFSYSNGLEAAIHAFDVKDADTAQGWIETILIGGSGRNDAIFMAQAHKAAGGSDLEREIAAINELAIALSSGAERAQETLEIGANFTRIAAQVYKIDLGELPPLAYPVAAGIAARRLGCDLSLSLTFFTQSFVANLISVAVRTVPIGQSDGQIILTNLMPVAAAIADEATRASLDDVGGYAVLADHAAIAHETQEPRIYRT